MIAASDTAKLLGAIRESVREHSDGEGHLADNRVLNGCRSVAFCCTQQWVAKRRAGRDVAAVSVEFRPLIEAAMQSFERPRSAAEPLPADAVREFLGWVGDRVEKAIGAAGA
ncbi:aminoglycoside adenylyltransferase domain-containing protein [Streptomyces zhihengii]|uniref:aminoglycoside adenylyltransferase domain-containing protein n=1 Tax=Streptomyces zhihengii TaxID=1818004 RepID=UPI00362527F1